MDNQGSKLHLGESGLEHLKVDLSIEIKFRSKCLCSCQVKNKIQQTTLLISLMY